MKSSSSIYPLESKGNISKTLHSILCFTLHHQTEMIKITEREIFYQFAEVEVEENVRYLLVLFFSHCDELFQKRNKV